MDIQLKQRSLVCRQRSGEPELLNGKPISQCPQERTIVDTEICSGEPCKESYCTEFSICPACNRGYREYGEVNLAAGVLVFRLPCLPALYDAISAEVMAILARDYPDVEITRCAGLPQGLVEAVHVAADLGVDVEDDDGPEPAPPVEEEVP